MWGGRVSARKLWVRIRNLPAASAFKRAVDPDGTRWGQTDHLIAQLIDTLHAVNGSDYRVPRPGSAEEKAAIARAANVRSARDRGRARLDAAQRRALEGRAG